MIVLSQNGEDYSPDSVTTRTSFMKTSIIILGSVAIFLGLFLGLGIQSYYIYDNHDLWCQGMPAAIPPEARDVNPIIYYTGWDFRLFPAELTCKWQIEGRKVITHYSVNPWIDRLSTALILVGTVTLLIPVIKHLKKNR